MCFIYMYSHRYIFFHFIDKEMKAEKHIDSKVKSRFETRSFNYHAAFI